MSVAGQKVKSTCRMQWQWKLIRDLRAMERMAPLAANKFEQRRK
jgi:hypothetical protein